MSGPYPAPGQYPDPSDPSATGQGPAGGPPPPSPVLTSDERGWGVAAHLSAFVGAWVLLAFIGPLVVWLVGRERHPFVDHHAKEALNFNLTFLLVLVVSGVLAIVGAVVTLGVGLVVLLPLGIVLGGVLALLWVIFTIIAAVKAWDGEGYRYPLTIRFVS